jgi:hypothetical protein
VSDCCRGRERRALAVGGSGDSVFGVSADDSAAVVNSVESVADDER